jgi:Spy/CpxP family protein refolding chaperone
MKALRGSSEEKQLLQRYTRQLDEQEDRLVAIDKSMDQAKRELEEARRALNEAIASLSFDLSAAR